MARVRVRENNLMEARRQLRRFLELSEDDPSLATLRERTMSYLERSPG
jgi:hypothetical protein